MESLFHKRKLEHLVQLWLLPVFFFFCCLCRSGARHRVLLQGVGRNGERDGPGHRVDHGRDVWERPGRWRTPSRVTQTKTTSQLVVLTFSCTSLTRVPCAGPAQLAPRALPGQQHRGELDAAGEPGHRGAWLHHRVWHRQSSRSDHQGGLQAALLHHREPR